VAAEKTVDFSAMAFADGTELTKTGSGSLKLGASVPSSLAVEAGRLVVGAAANYGSALTLGEGATLHFAAAGAAFASIAGLESANVTLDTDLLTPAGRVLFTSSDGELAQAISLKLLAAVESVSGGNRTLTVAELPGGGFALKTVSKLGLRILIK
jgi:hypothetical protein